MTIPTNCQRIPITGHDNSMMMPLMNGEKNPIRVVRNQSFNYQEPLPMPMPPVDEFRRIIDPSNRSTEFVLRGDTRDPATIKRSGGFMPAIGEADKGKWEAHDIDKHVAYETAKHTMYISFTRALQVAKFFGSGRWLFVARVHDGVDIQSIYGPDSMQGEVSAYAHVFWEDVYAFREEKSEATCFYINNDFVSTGVLPETLERAESLLLGGLQTIRSITE